MEETIAKSGGAKTLAPNEVMLRERLMKTIGAPGESPANLFFSAACPSRTILDHVTSKWGVLVIVALADGTLRWGELKRCIDGVSEKMLAQTLRILERDGLVHREPYATIPPRVDYSLTELGRDLAGQLIPLVRWVTVHSFDILGLDSTPI